MRGGTKWDDGGGGKGKEAEGEEEALRRFRWGEDEMMTESWNSGTGGRAKYLLAQTDCRVKPLPGIAL